MSGSGRPLPPPPGARDGQRSPTRTFRLRRSLDKDPQQGDMVIRALVRARLLGMQILTLEARVVVGTENGERPVFPFILSPRESSGLALRSSRPKLASAGSGSEFARAIELLQQGTDTLDRSRQSRSGHP